MLVQQEGKLCVEVAFLALHTRRGDLVKVKVLGIEHCLGMELGEVLREVLLLLPFEGALRALIRAAVKDGCNLILRVILDVLSFGRHFCL